MCLEPRELLTFPEVKCPFFYLGSSVQRPDSGVVVKAQLHTLPDLQIRGRQVYNFRVEDS